MEQEEARDFKSLLAKFQDNPAFLKNGMHHRPPTAEKPKAIAPPEKGAVCVNLGEGRETDPKRLLSLPATIDTVLPDPLHNTGTPGHGSPEAISPTGDHKHKKNEGQGVKKALKDKKVLPESHNKVEKPSSVSPAKKTLALPGRNKKNRSIQEHPQNASEETSSGSSKPSSPTALKDELTRVLPSRFERTEKLSHVDGNLPKQDLGLRPQSPKFGPSAVPPPTAPKPGHWSQTARNNPPKTGLSGPPHLLKHNRPVFRPPLPVKPESHTLAGGKLAALLHGHRASKNTKPKVQSTPPPSPDKLPSVSQGDADETPTPSSGLPLPRLPPVDYLHSERPLAMDTGHSKKHHTLVPPGPTGACAEPVSPTQGSPYGLSVPDVTGSEDKPCDVQPDLQADRSPVRRALHEPADPNNPPTKPPRPRTVDLSAYCPAGQEAPRETIEHDLADSVSNPPGDSEIDPKTSLASVLSVSSIYETCEIYDEVGVTQIQSSENAQSDGGAQTDLDSASQLKNEDPKKSVWFRNPWSDSTEEIHSNSNANSDRSDSPGSHGDKEQRKKERQRLQKERKEQRERAKKVNELQRKFKLTGLEEPLYHAQVISATKSWRNDLPVKVGDTVSIIRANNCPQGKWLARDCDYNYGYISVKALQLDIQEMLELGKRASQAKGRGVAEEDTFSMESRSSVVYPVSIDSFTDDSEEWSCDDELTPSPPGNEGHSNATSAPETSYVHMSGDCLYEDAVVEDGRSQLQNEALQKLAIFFQGRKESNEDADNGNEGLEKTEDQHSALHPAEEDADQWQTKVSQQPEPVQKPLDLKENVGNALPVNSWQRPATKIVNPYIDVLLSIQRENDELKVKRGSGDRAKRNKNKKGTKEEKEFRKKFQYTKPIEVQRQAVVSDVIAQEFPDARDLPIHPGETLDVIDVTGNNKLLCRNKAGKYGSVLIENLIFS
ncbi:FYN-binding protein 1 [Amia ocellicauda]|uniref:FYN-binding protein 1 n=1 Tax=Amia ocellicauda TaxID=2972642 RepID=UPI0034642EEE